MTAHRLTRDQARRLVVRAQLLDAQRPGDVVEVAEQLAYIKIDPTATIAPCEHTVLWSRIGWSYEPGQLRKVVEDDRLLFEFDGAFRPMSLLPLMLPAMRRWPQRQSSRQWLEANAGFRADVLARLRAEGPLLASDIPGSGVGWVVQAGRTGELVSPRDPVALAASLQRLRDDAAARARYGDAGRARWESHFRIDAVTRQWTQLYEDVLASSTAGRARRS